MSDDHSQHYSESSFWKKVKKVAKKIGRPLLHKSLILYYVGADPKTPKWAKGTVAAALGYFIWPLDAIPDFVPAVGYGDDAVAIAAALAAIAMCITKEHRSKATLKLRDWFASDEGQEVVKLPNN